MASLGGVRLGWSSGCLVAVTLGALGAARAQPPADAPPPPPAPPVVGPAVTADRPPPPPPGYQESAPPPPVPPPSTTAPIYPVPGPPPSGHAPGTEPSPGYTAPPVVTAAPPAPPLSQPYRGGPIPEGARLEGRRRPGLYIPGVVLFAAAYGSALYEYILYPHDPFIQNLAIPIVGPIVYGSKIDNMSGTMVMNTVLQATGVVLFALGMRERQILVFDVGPRTVALQPALGREHVGLTVRVL